MTQDQSVLDRTIPTHDGDGGGSVGYIIKGSCVKVEIHNPI